jgi:sugar phosphate isomerase/epimerase
MEKWPLGIFTSVDAGLGIQLEVLSELGVPTIQMHAPTKETRERGAEHILSRLEPRGVRITAVFGGFEGESYADIPTVIRTVGLVPPESRSARIAEMKEIADFARTLGVDVVALHLGFVPHDETDPLYKEVIAVTRDVCDHCAGNDQALHLETGQEPAETLLKFIADVQRDNLFINFDPANMILYGAGDPIEALKMLGPLVRSVHCKDATWAAHPGEEWGEEKPLGEGDVDMEKYLRTLDEIGYSGPLTIEREIPDDPARQKTEIGGALDLLSRLKTTIG